ncbi:MAG: FkbM family methyltransferase [Cyclobacteriaceae bacterium]
MSSKASISPKEVTRLIKKLHPFRFEKGLIRVGPNKDGGYLVPNDLEGIHSCFSPGVGDCSDFELWCFNQGINIFLADGSVDYPDLDLDAKDFHFLKKFIGQKDDAKCVSLNTWVQSHNYDNNNDLLLQMDIEGAEYDCLFEATSTLLKRFRIMIIEFHELDRLWQPDFFRRAEIVFEKILDTHVCIHIHPNNNVKIYSQSMVDIPPVAEFTFIRKDRTKSTRYETRLPHRLDYDNSMDLPSLVLPDIWYKKRWWDRVFSLFG